MYSSSAKQPLKTENPYYDSKRKMPTTIRDLQPEPLKAKSKKVKTVKPKSLRRTDVPAQRGLADAPGSLADMPGHMQYQRMIQARAAQARRIREDQLIDEQRRLVGDGVPDAERTAVKNRRKEQIELSGAQLTGQMFYPDVTGRGYSTSGTSLVGARGSFPASASGETIRDPPRANNMNFAAYQAGITKGKGKGKG